MQYNDEGYINQEKPLLMFHYMTQAEYHKRIEDDLLEQHRIVTSSKEAAAAFIDSLGIRHLLIPMTEKEIKAAARKRAKAAKKG